MNGPIESKTAYSKLLSVLMLLLALPVAAQVPVDEDGNPLGSYELQDSGNSAGDEGGDVIEPLSATELEDLVGPVALYPDDLLAIVLPASTYPLEIVQAARFLELLEEDSSLEPDEEWDDSIVALLNYPDVIRMLDEDIDWTWRLGEAVINQQNEVIAAVESFRDRAYAAGNLKTDEHQKVSYDDEGVLEIVPVSEELIYVPYYEPAEVVVYQPRPVYYYYPDPYPVYYYPYPTGYRFRSGYFWGVTTAFSIGWSNHYLHVYHPSYWGHPYYGRYYYGHYYRRPSINVYNNWYVNNSYSSPRYRYRDGDYWRSRNRSGSNQNVRNYHYAPNGSRNSRDYTVTRNNRVRVGDDGRMDLRLRQREGGNSAVNNSRSTRTITGSNTNADRSSSNSSSTRTRGVNRDVTDNRGRSTATGSRSSSRRTDISGSRNQFTFRDRSSAGSNRTGNQSSGNARDNRSTETTNRTVTTRRDNTARVSAPPRVTAPANRQATTNRTTNSRRTSAARITAPSRASAPATRRTTAPPRTSAPPRRTSPTPRSSAPAPRASAPAVRPSAPPRPRSSNRSTSRGNSAGSSRRATSVRPRVRNNQD